MRLIQIRSWFCVLLIIVLLSVSGCFESLSNFDFDQELRRANPYLNKIEVDNQFLLDYSLSIIQDIEHDDPANILNEIYRYIVENFQYISDPKDEEVIQSPIETINKKGGDCEDLSILLISLLENIGIESYLVLTDTHAYALASGIDPETLWPYVEKSLLEQVEKDNNESIRQQFSDSITVNKGWYYGGDGKILSDSFESLTFSFNITSNHAVDVYVVPSSKDFNESIEQDDVDDIHPCYYENRKFVSGQCRLNTYGGIGIHNKGFRPAIVNINLELYFKPSFYSLFQNETISSYLINGKQSVVLDPTAGFYGYPGYDSNVTGEKIAFDPITKDYVYLS